MDKILIHGKPVGYMVDLDHLITEGHWLIRDIKASGVDAMDKYLNAGYEITKKLELVHALGLHQTPPCEKILDISTCAGWLPWILEYFEHDVWYTDNLQERNPVPGQIREALGLHDCFNFEYGKIPVKKRTDEYIYKFRGLPVDGKFKIIFACSVSPHSKFSAKQLAMFIDDCLKRLLPGGYLYFAINQGEGMERLNELTSIYKSEQILNGWRILK